MSSIPIHIPEELVETISIFEYLDSKQLIKIQFTEQYQNKVIFQSFKVDVLEKSLKELEKKVKGAIPQLLNSQYIAIESTIYEDLDKIVKLQDENSDKAAKVTEKTLQLRKFVFDGKVYESILVDNRPYFITSDESGSYSLEERIEIAGNTFLPQDNITTVNPLPYKFESEEELEEYFVKAKNETFDSLFTKVRNEFKKYLNVPEHTLTVLSADIVYSYFQDKFGTTHYNIFIGENGSGKNSALLVFKHLGYRVFYVTAASAANYYTFLGDVQEGQGTIAEDEADDIGENKDKQRILKTGYANGETVPKVEFSRNGTRNQKPYFTFCHKWLAMEEIPDEREIRGVLDRSFIFKFLVGDVQYNIKDVVKDENSKLFNEISDLRKTLFVFKILHQKDEFEDIRLNIKNRNAELTKPLLRLFNSSDSLESIRESLSVLINEKSKIKSNSTESKILEALNELIKTKYKDYKEVCQFTNEEIFDALKKAMDGLENSWDEHTYSTFITPDGLHVSKKKITQLLKSKFNAVPDKIYEYGVTKRVIRVNRSWLRKLGKQYEVIDEIRILNSKSENERNCDPDTMTDQTLVESASPSFDTENDTSVSKEQVHSNELIIKNTSINNSVTKKNELAPVIGAGSDSVDYNSNNDDIIDKSTMELNGSDNQQQQELDKDNKILSSNNNTSFNIDLHSSGGINPSKNIENNGQAPSESVRSVRNSNNEGELNLKQFDNVEEEFDFDALGDAALKVFETIKPKEMKLEKGHELLNRFKIRTAILKDQNAVSKNLTIEIADRVINRLVKEGRLVESKEGWYYKNGNNATAAA